jgi:hypothetical protein
VDAGVDRHLREGDGAGHECVACRPSCRQRDEPRRGAADGDADRSRARARRELEQRGSDLTLPLRQVGEAMAGR